MSTCPDFSAVTACGPAPTCTKSTPASLYLAASRYFGFALSEMSWPVWKLDNVNRPDRLVGRVVELRRCDEHAALVGQRPQEVARDRLREVEDHGGRVGRVDAR